MGPEGIFRSGRHDRIRLDLQISNLVKVIDVERHHLEPDGNRDDEEYDSRHPLAEILELERGLFLIMVVQSLQG